MSNGLAMLSVYILFAFDVNSYTQAPWETNWLFNEHAPWYTI